MAKLRPVVVTGFGPFDDQDVNASWETVKELVKLGLDSCGIDLITQEIPVSYECVTREVPLIWEECEPKLVVHMGVSRLASEITLECTANRCGYCKPDVDGKCPKGGCCSGEKETIHTELDLENVCHRIRENPDMRIDPCISTDAGRYLCEFIYYTSLNINSSRTVFVHVPRLDSPYTAREMAECVKYIILYLMEQLGKSSEDLTPGEDEGDEDAESMDVDDNLVEESPRPTVTSIDTNGGIRSRSSVPKESITSAMEISRNATDSDVRRSGETETSTRASIGSNATGRTKSNVRSVSIDTSARDSFSKESSRKGSILSERKGSLTPGSSPRVSDASDVQDVGTEESVGGVGGTDRKASVGSRGPAPSSKNDSRRSSKRPSVQIGAEAPAARERGSTASEANRRLSTASQKSNESHRASVVSNASNEPEEEYVPKGRKITIHMRESVSKVRSSRPSSASTTQSTGTRSSIRSSSISSNTERRGSKDVGSARLQDKNKQAKDDVQDSDSIKSGEN